VVVKRLRRLETTNARFERKARSRRLAEPVVTAERY
jgi:hypothetical protein